MIVTPVKMKKCWLRKKREKNAEEVNGFTDRYLHLVEPLLNLIIIFLRKYSRGQNTFRVLFFSSFFLSFCFIFFVPFINVHCFCIFFIRLSSLFRLKWAHSDVNTVRMHNSVIKTRITDTWFSGQRAWTKKKEKPDFFSSLSMKKNSRNCGAIKWRILF